MVNSGKIIGRLNGASVPPKMDHWEARTQHSDQVLVAILSMADRQDLLLARRVGDLRQKVFELANIMGRPDADV